MSRDFHHYEPSHGHGLAHDPFNSIVGPRPIGWISTVDPDGRRNLAPYSFFNAFNYKPPIVGFASNGYKDTLRNVEAVGSFGWSLATLALAEAMNRSSAAVGREVDEFEFAGLTPAASRLIAAPRVAESPVSFECKVTEIHRLKTAAGQPVETWMTFGEVVAVYIDKALLHEGLYRTALAEPFVRGGGPGDYFKITEAQRFVMHRPSV